MSLTLREQAAALPLEPGVYLFKNDEGTVLYVGKAIKLRERVRSYFAKDIGVTRNPGIEKMVQLATVIDHQVVPTELEALMLEARLIRQYKPRYNIRLTDDKSFVVIKINMAEEFPSIRIGREKELEDALIARKRERTGVRISQRLDKTDYFGPFVSAGSVRAVLQAIRTVWPFRDSAPGVRGTFELLGFGSMTAEEYRKNIEQIRQFLKGERQTVMRVVTEQMEAAAAEERFEDAARYRNRLYNLEHFRHIIDTFRDAQGAKSNGYEYDPENDIRVECYDISNNQGEYTVGSLVCGIIRGGRSASIESRDQARGLFFYERARYRKFKIKTVEGISDVDSLREVLGRRFKRAAEGGKWELPDLIILDGGIGQYNAIKAVRDEYSLHDKVALAAVAKGPTRKKVDLLGNDWSKYPFVSTEAWQLVAELLREEAHRFAISYYRMLHRKALFDGSETMSKQRRETQRQLRRARSDM
jgi:excinuclease ABC subunit C